MAGTLIGMCGKRVPTMSAASKGLPPDLIRFMVSRKGLSISAVRLSDVTVAGLSDEFEQFEQRIFAEIRSTRTLEQLKDDPVFRSYRDLYWTFGMDPTKLRVSSEALVRRVLNGHNLWRVNNVVDVANLASAYHGLPIGLIDEDRLDGELVVRTAKRGEVFRRIGGKELVCRGREIVLADASKIVCFGFATHDADYTKVTSETTSVLLLIYGAPVVREAVMHDAMDKTLKMVRKWLECEVGHPRLYTGPG
ncbi:MAG: hypothetical protein DRO93_02405 [Candidatus Thorarchaeota archaeon]|nr:MAG: hypothetical protein DRO93_02405 [Candidatus Thorarchaeota archaeon]